jgi:hypothetical protein
MATARDIEGVHPSYFAGMPTVALDPKASKGDPQYARMLTDAMQNRAQATDRRRESDEANVFKAREQSQQARRDRRSNEISKRNAAVNEAGEARLKSGADFSQDRLKTADTRDLLDGLHKAYENKDTATFEFIRGELKKRGVSADAYDESQEDFNKRMPAPPPAPPPAAAKPPIDRTPVGPRPGPPPPTASFPPAGEAEAAPPMRAAPAGVAPRATASFPPTNGAPPPGPAPAPRPAPPAAAPPRAAAPPLPGWPAPPPPTDDSAFFQAPFDQAGLEAGLDNVSARAMPSDKQILDAYIAEDIRRRSAGLPSAPNPKSLLPGKTLRRRAAESDQMLAPGDPLLNPRAQ